MRAQISLYVQIDTELSVLQLKRLIVVIVESMDFDGKRI